MLSQGDPWYLEGVRNLEYDPDRAKAMLKEARAVGTAVKIIANTNCPSPARPSR